MYVFTEEFLSSRRVFRHVMLFSLASFFISYLQAFPESVWCSFSPMLIPFHMLCASPAEQQVLPKNSYKTGTRLFWRLDHESRITVNLVPSMLSKWNKIKIQIFWILAQLCLQTNTPLWPPGLGTRWPHVGREGGLVRWTVTFSPNLVINYWKL